MSLRACPSPSPQDQTVTIPEAHCAHGGWRRRPGHERYRVCVVARVLLPDSALFHLARRTVRACPSPRALEP